MTTTKINLGVPTGIHINGQLGVGELTPDYGIPGQVLSSTATVPQWITLPSSVISSSTVPDSPSNGQLWWDETDQQFKQYNSTLLTWEIISIGEQGPIGYTGSRGETGLGFKIAKTYTSVSALVTDTAPTGIMSGEFAIIETGSVEDAENSRLYLWNGTSYIYTSDLSGAQGITGPQGIQGPIGYTGSQGSTGYTGSQGSIGYTGSQGTAGIQGPVGYTGSQGSGGSTTTVSATAPSNPAQGDLWCDTQGKLYVYNSSTWTDLGLGYRDVPQNIRASDYTLTLNDRGKHIYHPAWDEVSRTITIPSNETVPFPVGAAITFINMTVAYLTILVNTDQLYVSGNGILTSIQLSQYGMATAVKISHTEWIMSGTGLV